MRSPTPMSADRRPPRWRPIRHRRGPRAGRTTPRPARRYRAPPAGRSRHHVPTAASFSRAPGATFQTAAATPLNTSSTHKNQAGPAGQMPSARHAGQNPGWPVASARNRYAGAYASGASTAALTTNGRPNRIRRSRTKRPAPLRARLAGTNRPARRNIIAMKNESFHSVNASTTGARAVSTTGNAPQTRLSRVNAPAGGA